MRNLYRSCRLIVLVAAVLVLAGVARAASISGVSTGSGYTQIYCIDITDPAAFSATLVNSGTTPLLDTMLFLLDSNMKAVEGNDDTLNHVGAYDPRSTLPAGNPFSPTSAGTYYLAISVFQNIPVDAANASLFSPVPLGEGVSGPNVLAGAFDHFTQLGTYGGEVVAGNYRIDLVGGQACPDNASSLVLLGAGMVSIGLFGWMTKRNAVVAV